MDSKLFARFAARKILGLANAFGIFAHFLFIFYFFNYNKRGQDSDREGQTDGEWERWSLPIPLPITNGQEEPIKSWSPSPFGHIASQTPPTFISRSDHRSLSINWLHSQAIAWPTIITVVFALKYVHLFALPRSRSSFFFIFIYHFPPFLIASSWWSVIAGKSLSSFGFCYPVLVFDNFIG